MNKKQKGKNKKRTLTGFLILLLLVVSASFWEAGTVFAESLPEVRFLASPASGGRISRKTKEDGTLVITASANKGYRFCCWKKKGNDEIFTKNASFKLTRPYTSAVYVAYFETDPEYCARSGISDQGYAGGGRQTGKPAYLYDSNVIKEIAQNRIRQDGQIYQSNRPAAAGKKAVENIQKILDTEKQKKEEIYDEELLSEDELITSHQEVLQIMEVQKSDQDQEEIEKAVQEKFGDGYKAEILRSLQVSPPQEWEDGVRTCLWMGTGAEKGDMVYISYETDDQEMFLIAAVVDDSNVLRFTVPTILNTTRMMAVRIQLDEEAG